MVLALGIVFYSVNSRHYIYYTVYYSQILKMSKEKDFSLALPLALQEEEHLKVQVRLFSRVIYLSNFLIADFVAMQYLLSLAKCCLCDCSACLN